MGLFLGSQDKLVRLSEIRFNNERAIQSLTRKNLEEIFNIELIKNEFPIGGDRADILAYDKKRRSFVIIEFKKEKKRGTLEQLRSYLSLAKKNKASLCQEYGKKHNRYFDASEVNWDKMIGIAIAPSFSSYQINDAEDDYRIELCEVHRYENDIFEFKHLGSVEDRTEADFPTPLQPKTTDLESHLNRCNENIRQIYEELERQIMGINNNIELLVKKVYVSFEIHDRAFVRFYTKKNKILIYMRLKSDEMHIPRRSTLVIKKGMRNYVGGNSEIAISEKSDIVHLMKLVKQSYEKTVQQKLPPIQRGHTEYTEAEYLDGQYIKFNLPPEIRQLWSEIRHQILNLGDIETKQAKTYLGFYPKGEKRSICGLEATNSKLKLTYNTKVRDGLLSPSDFVEDISNIGHWAPGDYRSSNITTKSDIARAIPLVEKIYRAKTLKL